MKLRAKDATNKVHTGQNQVVMAKLQLAAACYLLNEQVVTCTQQMKPQFP